MFVGIQHFDSSGGWYYYCCNNDINCLAMFRPIMCFAKCTFLLIVMADYRSLLFSFVTTGQLDCSNQLFNGSVISAGIILF